MSAFIDQLLAQINQGAPLPLVLDSTPARDRLHHALAVALLNLRQRFNPPDAGKQLVERLRVDRVPRYRPVRNVARASLRGDDLRLAELAPAISTFSDFQVLGWQAVRQAMADRATIVILAPTGSGKTEVFVLPIVDAVSRSLAGHPQSQERFLLIYPRVELLKDQLSRILRAVHFAEAARFGGQRRILVGMQFSGIKSSAQATLRDRQVFDADGLFQHVKDCPVCGRGSLQHGSRSGKHYLRCTDATCRAEWWVSLAKQDHRTHRPHVMVSTAEALDRFYLDPQFESYLNSITGLALDEAHLYHGVYGTHIQNVFARFDRLRAGKPLVRIASSATIVDPARFVAKLMLGDEGATVRVHDAQDCGPMQPSGEEFAYFVQATDNSDTGVTRQTSALIQTAMLLGHGVFREHERILAFVDSIDQTERFQKQIENAERQKALWRFRTVLDEIRYRDEVCPKTSPERCTTIFQVGECWRGIHTSDCCAAIPRLRDAPLEITTVSRVHRNDFTRGDVVIATPTLEVGVDDERILSTVHYQAPVTGVHGFIQRRGRAGRKAGDDAFTFMVLGQSPTEQYYFYRRHRLLHGKYMLPLNVSNLIVTQMHQHLEEARTEIAARLRGNDGIQRPLHEWIIDRLRACSLLSRLYAPRLDGLRPGAGLAAQLRAWIEQEMPQLRQRLEFRALVRELRATVPDLADVRADVDVLMASLDGYSEGAVSHAEVQAAFKALGTTLSTHLFEQVDEEGLSIGDYQRRLVDLFQAFGGQNDLRVRFAEQLFDFFEALSKFNEPPNSWKLNSAPDAIKIVLQSLYYLHLGDVRAFEGGCPADVTVLVPDAYFGETRLVVVEARVGQDAGYQPQKHSENISFLSSILLPYGLTYRYFGRAYLGTIDAAPVGEATLAGDGVPEVKLELAGQGIDRDGFFEAQKVQVRPLRPSDEGSDVLKLCPVCYRLHSVTKTTPCHGAAPLPVKVYPSAITDRTYTLTQALHRFSRQFALAEQLRTNTIVRGSEVSAIDCVFREGEYKQTRQTRNFRALYAKPLRYGLTTTGIVWTMPDLVAGLMADEGLKSRVEAVHFDHQPRRLEPKLILTTAANLLVRAIVAVAGVNGGNLEFAVKPDRGEVCVWESIEGGAGLSQVFMNTLRASPFEVYRELLGGALCSVGRAEADPAATRQDLESEIGGRWHLAKGDPQLVNLLDDIAAEQAAIATSGSARVSTCAQHDGCPACIQSAESGPRRQRGQFTSRMVAEAILSRLVQDMRASSLETAMLEAARDGLTPPQQIAPETEGGTVRVLVL